ncbi:MAG: ABC transporter ATP-binding protein [Chloroflexi bacterium]|nr:ABC transporter ATP-binding protein [Chloroflexota bacterium]
MVLSPSAASEPPATPAGWLLYTHGLAKSYGANEVLRDVTMGLQPGTVVGLLGPNGAGKTTLLNILAGIFPPTRGAVWLEGAWVDFDREPEQRRGLGLILGGRMLIEELRPPEYFAFVAAMYGATGAAAGAYVDDLIRRLRLEAHLDKPIKNLSAGTRKKVEFVAAVLHRPRVLLFDEPFEAIDPPSVLELTEVTRDYIRSSGGAAIVSSHILPYVRPLATEIRLLWNGQLYEKDQLEELLRNRADDAELRVWGAVLEGG